MNQEEIITRYNYDAFVPAKFRPWMRFKESPPVGERAPDFPLWRLDESETSLGAIWRENALTVVEFGSFT